MHVQIEIEIRHVFHQGPLVSAVRRHGAVELAQPAKLKHCHAAGVGNVGFQVGKYVQRAAADQIPEEQCLIDAIANDRGGFELVIGMLFAPVDRLVKAMHHDRHVELRELLPNRE